MLRGGRLLPVAGVVAPAVFALLAASALATPARGGGSYRGTLSGAHSSITISFGVSSKGTTVERMHISALPIYCRGKGPPGAPSLLFRPSPISPAGTFTSVGRDVIRTGPLKGSVAATVTVTGAFKAGGREQGRISTSFGGGAEQCDGRSSYSTRA